MFVRQTCIPSNSTAAPGITCKSGENCKSAREFSIHHQVDIILRYVRLSPVEIGFAQTLASTRFLGSDYVEHLSSGGNLLVRAGRPPNPLVCPNVVYAGLGASRR
jgi:hypothetical protein